MRFWESDLYFEDEQFKEILQEYEQSQEEGSVPYLSAEDLTDIAEYYYAHHQEDKAKGIIHQAISMYPDSSYPLIYLVRDHLCNDEWRKAKNLLKCIKDLDDDREVMYLNVEVLLHEGRTMKAAKLLDEFFPDDDSAYEQRMYMREVISLLLDYEGSDVDNLMCKWADRLIEADDKEDADYMMLADMYSNLGQFDKATELLQTVIDENPYNKQAWVLMTDIKTMAGKKDEAQEAAEYAMAIDDTDFQTVISLIWLKACNYQDLKEKSGNGKNEDELARLHDECLQELKLASQKGLEDTDEFNLTIADILMYIDEPLMAIPYFEKELELSPDKANVQYFTALAKMEVQNYSEAAELLEKVADSDGDKEDRGFDTDAPLAFCYFMLRDMKRCLPLLKRVCQENPESASDYFATQMQVSDPREYYNIIKYFYGSR